MPRLATRGTLEYFAEGILGKVFCMENHLLMPQMTASLYLGQDDVLVRRASITVSATVGHLK